MGTIIGCRRSNYYRIKILEKYILKRRSGYVMLQRVSNGYVAKTTFKSSLPKVQNDDQAAKQFKEGFNLSRTTMKLVGLLELTGSIFLFISVLSRKGKKFAKIGTLLINIVLGGAVFKHLQAGHGYEGSKKALNLLGLNILNFIEAMRK